MLEEKRTLPPIRAELNLRQAGVADPRAFQRGEKALAHGEPILRDDEVTGKVERSDRTSARKMYAMRECMLKHDIG